MDEFQGMTVDSLLDFIDTNKTACVRNLYNLIEAVVLFLTSVSHLI